MVELRKALAAVSCHQEDYALAPPQGMAAGLEDSTIPVTGKVGQLGSSHKSVLLPASQLAYVTP